MKKLYSIGLVGFVVLLVTASCGKDNKGTQSAPEEAAITDIATIANTADRRTLVGRKVDIANATVQQVVGTYIFWAGEPHTAVPVAREDKMRGPVTEHVRKGESSRITGTIRLLTTVPVTDQLWDKINEQERRDILAAQVYVAADRVSVVHEIYMNE